MIVIRALGRYWAWAGSNVGAMPACAVVAGVFAYLFRDRIGRACAAWWHKHHGEHSRADLAAMEKRLKDHLTAGLADHQAAMSRKLTEHHEAMQEHVAVPVVNHVTFTVPEGTPAATKKAVTDALKAEARKQGARPRGAS